jgi:hypothetical protein
MENSTDTVLSACRAHGRRAAALLMALMLFGCNTDGLLEAESPSDLDAKYLEQPEYAGLHVNGVIADFTCAFGAFVLTEAIVSDELADAQFNAAAWPLDRRDVPSSGAYGTNACTGNQVPGLYTPLSVARWSADNALARLGGWTDAQVAKRDSLRATAALYAGFSYTLLGMSMCSAAVDGGPEMTPAQLFAVAEERFSTVLGITDGGRWPLIHGAALIGRARVRLYQENDAGAAADAALVPDDFVFFASAEKEVPRAYNRVYAATIQNRYYTVEPSSLGLTTGGVEDPRTAAVNNGLRGQDGTTVWQQQKYRDLASPIPFARTAEARLITAEVEGGQTAVDIINDLRDAVELPHLESEDEAEIQNAVIEERRRELWLEGFRLHDIVRGNLPLDPPAGSPYQPTKNGVYGTTLCLPLPDVERFHNPNID